MEVQLPNPGVYVIAVSGGVDSMVLLDLLSKKAPQNKLHLVVAHFDHGIRRASYRDRQLVEQTAKDLKLPFEYAEGQLGPATSEAKARGARYKFLDEVKAKHKAKAVVTAHHQDDQIETAIINLLRGTGRKGLAPLNSTQARLRPLLGYSKQEIMGYALEHKLRWAEDETNLSDNYLRNYIRHNIVPKLTKAKRLKFVRLINKQELGNQEIDQLLTSYLNNEAGLNRQLFNSLAHNLAREVMASWLRQNGVRDFNKQQIENLVIRAKVAQPSSAYPVKAGIYMKVAKDNLALLPLER